MIYLLIIIRKQKGFSALLDELSYHGINPDECMQCGKCSASCPINQISTILPHQVMRLLQLGIDNESLKQYNLFHYCLSCFSCQERCPQGIEIPKLMRVIWRKLFWEYNEIPLERDVIISFREKGLPEQAVITGLKKYQQTVNLKVKRILKKL